MSEELKDYTAKCLREGIKKDALKDMLLKAGWGEESVEQVFEDEKIQTLVSILEEVPVSPDKEKDQKEEISETVHREKETAPSIPATASPENKEDHDPGGWNFFDQFRSKEKKPIVEETVDVVGDKTLDKGEKEESSDNLQKKQEELKNVSDKDKKKVDETAENKMIKEKPKGVNLVLKKYIIDNLKRGFSSLVIKDAALEAGWAKEDLNEIFLEKDVLDTIVEVRNNPKKVLSVPVLESEEKKEEKLIKEGEKSGDDKKTETPPVKSSDDGEVFANLSENGKIEKTDIKKSEIQKEDTTQTIPKKEKKDFSDPTSFFADNLKRESGPSDLGEGETAHKTGGMMKLEDKVSEDTLKRDSLNLGREKIKRRVSNPASFFIEDSESNSSFSDFEDKSDIGGETEGMANLRENNLGEVITNRGRFPKSEDYNPDLVEGDFPQDSSNSLLPAFFFGLLILALIGMGIYFFIWFIYGA